MPIKRTGRFVPKTDLRGSIYDAPEEDEDSKYVPVKSLLSVDRGETKPKKLLRSGTRDEGSGYEQKIRRRFNLLAMLSKRKRFIDDNE